MKTALDQGFSVKDILAPYLTRAAQELGISAAEIDLTDPLWRQLVEQTDEKGERVRPNTQQILAPFEPVLEEVDGGMTYRRPRLVWSFAPRHAVALGAAAFIALISITRVSEFLYWQF